MSSPKQLIACLCLVLSAFALKAEAQACGAYYISISVKDKAGAAVNNAQVDLMPIVHDETRGKVFVRDTKDPSVFSIQLPEGRSFEFFHKIIVSAPGFKDAAIQAKFLSCASRAVVVTLSKKGAAAWQFKNTVEVEATADGSKDIRGLKLKIVDSHGRSQDVPVQGWFAFVELANGEYTFRFDAPGYETLVEKVDLSPLADKHVTVDLKKTK